MNLTDFCQKLISDDEFNELLQEHVDRLRDYCTKGATEVYPDLLVFEPKDKEGKYELTVLAIRSNDFNEHRYEFMEMLGAEAESRKLNPVATFIASEAWMKTFAEEEHFDTTRAPSSYEDKQEVVFVAGMTLDKRCNMAVIPISKDDGKIQLGNPSVIPYNSNRTNPESDLLAAFYWGYIKVITSEKDKN